MFVVFAFGMPICEGTSRTSTIGKFDSKANRLPILYSDIVLRVHFSLHLCIKSSVQIQIYPCDVRQYWDRGRIGQ